MGNFEKLSVLVIVVIIVMILVVALYTWTGEPEGTTVPGATADAGPIVNPPPQTPPPFNPSPFPQPPAPPPAAMPPGGTPLVGMGDPVVTPSEPPAPAPAPAPPKPADDVIAARDYTIQPGDTLGGISTKIYGSKLYVPDIERANPGIDPMRLRVKQVIHLPEVKVLAKAAPGTSRSEPSTTTSGSGPKAGATYTVRRGDTLPGIAKSAWGNVERWPELLIANYEVIDNPDRLSAGTRLRIPR